MNRLEPLVITVERRDSFYVKVVDAAGAAGLPLVRSMHLEPVEARVERFDRRGTEPFEPFEPFEFFQNRNFP